MRRFIIRTDAGENVGFGHVVRSLCLAKYLRNHYGIETIFYSNSYKKLENIYQKNRFQYVFNGDLSEIELLHKIGEDNPDSILFIDKLFPYDRDTIRDLRNKLKIIMFHNECEGMYESDYAIFPSAHLSDEIIQNRKWSKGHTKFLYGPDYIIINEEIIDFLKYNKPVVSMPYIVVTTGASDPEGILIQVMEWFNESEISAHLQALYGFDFHYKAELESMLPHLKPTIKVKEFNYSDLFSASLAISAFGVTTYELIYANIPVATLGHIKKNSVGAKILQGRYGCNYHLGLFKEITRDQFITSIQFLWNHEEELAIIRKNQQNLIDGRGLERLGQIISHLYSN